MMCIIYYENNYDMMLYLENECFYASYPGRHDKMSGAKSPQAGWQRLDRPGTNNFYLELTWQSWRGVKTWTNNIVCKVAT